MQIGRPRVHRPRFGESRFAIGVLNLLLVYTALAWVLVLIPEEPYLLSAVALSDAEVVERDAERVTLRVSHPTEQQLCGISRAEFDGDLPEVGDVIPVEYEDTYCYLPAWSDTAPSLAMKISAVLGTVILVGWTVRAFTRPQPQSGGGPQRPAAPADRSRAKSRRRRKRRLKR